MIIFYLFYMNMLFPTGEEKIQKAQTELELQRIEQQKAREAYANKKETDAAFRMREDIRNIASDTGKSVFRAISRVTTLPYTAVNYLFDNKTEKIADDFSRVVNVLSGVTTLISPESFNAMIGMIESLDPKVAMALKGAYAILAGVEKNKNTVKNGADVKEQIIKNSKTEEQLALAQVDSASLIDAVGKLGNLTADQKESFKIFASMAKQAMPKVIGPENIKKLN